MKKWAAVVCIFGLLLCGCDSWLDGRYVSVTPHLDSSAQSGQDDIIAAESYMDLCGALAAMVEDGLESAAISVAAMEPSEVQRNMDLAVDHVLHQDPIGAYAVESIEYEEGTSGGTRAVAVTIKYNFSRPEIRRIPRLQGMEEVKRLIRTALEQCEAGLVVLVEGYSTTDFTQFIQDYADQNPQTVIEVPTVTVNLYPDSGTSRLVDLKFTYQTDRNSLRVMQARVRRVFDSARLYVSSDAPESEKYSLLASFLTNLTKQYEYQFETSITPSYSLLCHGVGDSKAHAVAYAAMCRQVDLECLVVSGTKDGAPWFWNIICEDGVYYHVDMIDFSQSESFQRRSDPDMAGYVWDYSAYPACQPPEPPEPPTEAQPETQPETEPTVPPETQEETTAPKTEPTELTEPPTETVETLPEE